MNEFEGCIRGVEKSPTSAKDNSVIVFINIKVGLETFLTMK